MAKPTSDSSTQESRTFSSTYEDESKDKLAAEVRHMYHEAIQSTAIEMRDYWLNHAFLHGYQWLYWSETAGRLDEIPDDPERVQATINRLWPSTRTIMANLLQRSLVFEVPPNDVDDSHIRGAKIAESVLRAVHQEHDWELLRENLAYAAWKGGTAAIDITWDPDADEIMTDRLPGDAPLGSGDTVEEHLNITQFVVEPGTFYPERARWWIKGVALPPHQVKETFKLDDLPPTDATAGLAPFQRKLMSYDRGGDGNIVDLTMVLTLFQRPGPDHPEGRVVTVVDNQVVFDAEWPFPFKDRLNLVVVRETPRENRWTGDTVLTSARPIQTLLNVAYSSIVEHMKLAGNARLLTPLSSLEIMRQATDLPGEIIPYNDSISVKPGYLTPPVMPEWWMKMPHQLAEEMDDALGVHAISRGDSPANIESGFGLTILAEKDNTPVNRLSKEFARAFGRLGSMALEIYEQETKGAKIKRKSVVKVPGSSPLTVMWNGEDFKGQTHALVPEDAILPRSQAAQLDMAKDMLEVQLITTLPEFIAVAEMPGHSEILAAVSPDIDRARRENAQFGLGRQSVVHPWDNHKDHIHEHNKYRKTVDYDLLDEEAKELIEEHIGAHETMGAEEIGRGRALGAVDPALASAPTATEAPIVPPVDMLQGPSAGPPAGPVGPEPLDLPEVSPEVGSESIMDALRNMG